MNVFGNVEAMRVKAPSCKQIDGTTGVYKVVDQSILQKYKYHKSSYKFQIVEHVYFRRCQSLNVVLRMVFTTNPFW